MRCLAFILLMTAISAPAQDAPVGNFGWIPEFKKLTARAGLGLAFSSQNFDSGADRLDVRVGSESGKFSEVRFLTEAEYGIAEDWALGTQISLLNSSVSSVNTGDTLASGAGLGDIITSLKYNFKTSHPQLTAEARVRFPTGRSSASAVDDLVLGDGSFDLSGLLHLGHRGKGWRLAVSPGITGRSGGYSSAIIGGAAVDILFPRGYVRVFGDGMVSLQETRLSDSSIDVHDSIGSGGTNLRLAGSPTYFKAGGLFGFKIFNEYHLEASAAHTIFGMRAPHFLQLGFFLRGTWDFFKADKRKRIREVPLDSDGTDKFYDPEA